MACGQTYKLTANDGVSNDEFGASVSISDDGLTAFVGARYSSNGNLVFAGSAYIYKYINGAWSQTQKLTASDAAASDFFGGSVSISGDGLYAIVGAPQNDDSGFNSGSAYIIPLL